MLDKKHDGFFDEEGAEESKSAELLKMVNEGAEARIKAFSAGDKVSGKVTRVSPDYVFIDIGARNEAMIKASELSGSEVKPGDTVNWFVVSDTDGETVVSKRAGSGGGVADIEALREAQSARLPVQGKVTGVSKAGLAVKIMGHRAFCPVSQIDVKYTSDVNEYLSKTLDFVITRITEGGKNIVVSRVPLFEAGLEDQFKTFADAAGSNKVFKGKVSKIVEFGLFVEAGGLEGLVHISEVSWERAQNLNDTFTVGQEVEFVVLKVERKDSMRNSKVSLSMKQALEDPWTKVSDAVKVGESVEGKVTRLADFGAFVEVISGVEGLVHVSEMAWGRRVHHPSEIVKPGQMVKVTVLGIDLNKRSVSLTLKDVADDPWNGIEDKLSVGTDVSGTVARKTKFGYFIDLFEGVTGLLVFSRMAADKKESLKPGDTVTVQVESIDIDARRVALSMGVSDTHKETEDTKQYMKRQNAKQEKKSDSAPKDTAMGAAFEAVLGKLKTSAPKAAEKAVSTPEATADKTASTPVTKDVSIPVAAAATADKTASTPVTKDVSIPTAPAAVSTPAAAVDKAASTPVTKDVSIPATPVATVDKAVSTPAVAKDASIPVAAAAVSTPESAVTVPSTPTPTSTPAPSGE